MRLGEWHLDRKASGVSFEPRFLWVGVSWDRTEGALALDPWARETPADYRRLGGLLVSRIVLTISLVPMLPLVVEFVRRRPVLEPRTYEGASIDRTYADEVVDTEERPGVMSRLRKLGKEEE